MLSAPGSMALGSRTAPWASPLTFFLPSSPRLQLSHCSLTPAAGSLGPPRHVLDAMQQDAWSPPWRLLPWPRPRPTASLPFPALAVAEPPLLQTELHLRPAVTAPCTAFPCPCFPPARRSSLGRPRRGPRPWRQAAAPPVYGCQPLLPFCPTAQQLCAPPPMDAQKFQQRAPFLAVRHGARRLFDKMRSKPRAAAALLFDLHSPRRVSSLSCSLRSPFRDAVENRASRQLPFVAHACSIQDRSGEPRACTTQIRSR
ncbi:uncharacterized protein [Zea mays]|uniref:uncharacterized protein n=1 Tax=Zea mays TaxID=4577 RepID=UPI0004DEC4A3|nr:uncharacterized protein LOC103643277 [Zea mays]|eukprot:XP_008664662.1 uncharacterized protein LOC103643277 [Zea mays]